VVEVQQFQQPQTEDLDGCGTQVTSLLEEHGLRPTRFLHFGRDQELPQQEHIGWVLLVECPERVETESEKDYHFLFTGIDVNRIGV